MQEFIDKFRFNAKRASLVQSRIKALARMPVLEAPAKADAKWNFSFPDPEDIGRPVLQVDSVGFGYKRGGPLLFDNVSFGVDTSSRVALLGANGVGKSTLLKLMLDELDPVHGRIVRNRKLRVGYFTQHHMDQLNVRRTPLEELLALFPGSKPDQVRKHLGRFGLSGDLALQTIGEWWSVVWVGVCGWVCGRVGVWVCVLCGWACVGVWVCGCVGVWVCGCVVIVCACVAIMCAV